MPGKLMIAKPDLPVHEMLSLINQSSRAIASIAPTLIHWPEIGTGRVRAMLAIALELDPKQLFHRDEGRAMLTIALDTYTARNYRPCDLSYTRR